MRNLMAAALAMGMLSSGSLQAQPSPPPAAAASTQDLAKAPQTPGAKGDQQRHYHFAAAGKEMPYRLYVPRSYDPKRGAPLVIALHGFNGDQDTFFKAQPDLPALLEKHGFIFVAPMGYAPDGWYGAPLNIPGETPRSPDASGKPRPTPASLAPDQERRKRDLSEADVMNVLALVRKEYKVDPNRIFLMGHSMGGMGTWYLGQKHADIWAAIAPMSGVLPGVDYSLPRLRKVPVMVSIGGLEGAWVASSKAQVETMKGMGMKAAYVEIDGATHGGMVGPTVPQVLAFFAEQKKAAR